MRWRPKSVVCLSYYNLFRFRADVFAALILFLQHLPLAIAIAIATGVHPLYGISCVAVSGFLASALGDSKIRVSAPNVVFVGVASTIVAREGILGLSLATLLAGVLLIVLGAVGLGSAIKLLPRPVTLGFSTGIAVLVAGNQFPNLLGINPQVQPHQGLWEQVTVVLHLTQIGAIRNHSRSFCFHRPHNCGYGKITLHPGRLNRGCSGSLAGKARTFTGPHLGNALQIRHDLIPPEWDRSIQT
jgi:SulP family sulfate permease